MPPQGSSTGKPPGKSRWLVPLAVVTGVVLMLAMLQRQLIYFPAREPLESLSAAAAARGLQVWRGEGGEYLGWRSGGQDRARNRMVVFHGNAGHALHRDYFAAGLEALGDEWEVYLFEYPGYGGREGSPSADAIKSAAEAALSGLLATPSPPVFLLGESLGSGVASHLAATFPTRVAGLLLVTPFTSLADVASRHYPFLPVRALLSERFDSLEALSHYRGPVAFLLAGKDEVVATELGQELHDSYDGPSWLRIQANAGHNTLDYHPRAAWWGEMSRFLTGDN